MNITLAGTSESQQRHKLITLGQKKPVNLQRCYCTRWDASRWCTTAVNTPGRHGGCGRTGTNETPEQIAADAVEHLVLEHALGA
ncbi:hypothetical protein [Streptomyces sp. N35]|uniref:hypothetical protein n=1 Tax=Streptomyces sp. N35 TaxID=2795730 RepID=UPI0018F2FE6B|nr:hypothetical protein [Streptomyces sp. N35]